MLNHARQSLDQVIESQPQRPAMMIERERKPDGDGEQNHKCRSITKRGQQQEREIRYQDENFGSDDICHDRADKKSFFAFEDDAAGIAAMF